MSRGWIIGIVCLAITGSSTLNGWAQEGRPNHSEGMSFSQRLAALKKTFKREKPSASKTQNAPQGRSQNNNSSRSSVASKPSGTSTPFNASQAGTRSRRNKAASSGSDQQPNNENTPRVASKKRVGSVSSGKATSQQGRYPSASNNSNNSVPNNIAAILSDLSTKEDGQTPKAIRITAAESSSSTTKEKSTRRSPTAKRGLFDVHEALVGKQEENIAETEVAAENVAESDLQLTPIPEAPATSKKAKTLPSVAKSQSQVIRTLPAVQEPQPAVIDPTPATRYPETEHRSAISSAADPFEAAPEEAFSANPMRSKSPTSIEQIAPIQQRKHSTGEVLLSSKQPVIVSHVKGPRRIMVGREATYQVTLENTSNTKAKSIAAAVRIPEWAEIIEVTSTNGAVERGSEDSSSNILEWQLQELAARSSATLRLRLIPRSGRPMRLGVQWSQAPVASETMVEVQEPKLEVGLSGPQEVLFGQAQRYRLILRNPGTGVAEKVVVQLIPPGGDEQSATTQTIGALQPGEVKEIELELTAREAGELIMQASAVADGGLSAQAVKKVICRRPELQVDWRGPETKYAGTISAYYVRVQNPGTAMTEPVTVTFELPEGSQFVSASEGHSIDKASRTISWRLAGLAVDEAQFMQVRCQIDKPGINRFSVTAQIDNGELSDTKTIETKIVALADLKLEVTDPQGPLPLGESALYEIRVRNRGRTAAQGINIVGLFSAGIDPVSVEGAQYTERDGRVIFNPIKKLPAGREVVLRIRAKATQAGTHIFRAEVSCQDLDIKLAAEETTRFFKDATRWEDGRWEDGQTPYSAENGEKVNR